MKETVLDGKAVLALLNDEPRSGPVGSLLPGAFLSTVNFAKIITRPAEAGPPEWTIKTVLGKLGLTVIPFDKDSAFRKELWHPATSDHCLWLDYRACLALVQHLPPPCSPRTGCRNP